VRRDSIESEMQTEGEALTRKEREFQQRRREILDTAELVFSEKGYVSATMEEVARRAEFAVGTLYKFFQNKAELHEEIMRAKLDLLEQKVRGEMQSGTSPLEQIRRGFQARIDFFWEHPRFFKLFFHETRGTVCDPRAGSAPEITERYHAFLEKLQLLFNRGIQEGEFRPLGAPVLVLVHEGILHAYLTRLIRTEDPVRQPEEEALLFEAFSRGTVVPGSKSGGPPPAV
jgi:TetR/AcrR family transcriptional regulator